MQQQRPPPTLAEHLFRHQFVTGQINPWYMYPNPYFSHSPYSRPPAPGPSEQPAQQAPPQTAQVPPEWPDQRQYQPPPPFPSAAPPGPSWAYAYPTPAWARPSQTQTQPPPLHRRHSFSGATGHRAPASGTPYPNPQYSFPYASDARPGEQPLPGQTPHFANQPHWSHQATHTPSSRTPPSWAQQPSEFHPPPDHPYWATPAAARRGAAHLNGHVDSASGASPYSANPWADERNAFAGMPDPAHVSPWPAADAHTHGYDQAGADPWGHRRRYSFTGVPDAPQTRTRRPSRQRTHHVGDEHGTPYAAQARVHRSSRHRTQAHHPADENTQAHVYHAPQWNTPDCHDPRHFGQPIQNYMAPFHRHEAYHGSPQHAVPPPPPPPPPAPPNVHCDGLGTPPHPTPQVVIQPSPLPNPQYNTAQYFTETPMRRRPPYNPTMHHVKLRNKAGRPSTFALTDGFDGSPGFFNIVPRPKSWRRDFVSFSKARKHRGKAGLAFVDHLGKVRQAFSPGRQDSSSKKELPTELYKLNAHLAYRNDGAVPISYDMRTEAEFGEISFPSVPRRLNQLDFKQFATEPPTHAMALYHARLPWHLRICSKHENGITIADVLMQIADSLMRPLRNEDMFNDEMDAEAREEVLTAYHRRTRGNAIARSKGPVRMDFLGLDVVFTGLAKGKDGMWEIKTVSVVNKG